MHIHRNFKLVQKMEKCVSTAPAPAVKVQATTFLALWLHVGHPFSHSFLNFLDPSWVLAFNDSNRVGGVEAGPFK